MKSFTTTLFVCTIALLAGPACAWVIPKQLRHAAAAAAIAGAVATTPLVADAVSFSDKYSGFYNDPKHPGCERLITASGASASISLRDGTPGCNKGEKTKKYKVVGEIAGDKITVDFSGKGGPRNIEGSWTGDGIQWADGNKWSKL
ncbi:predicted protein [Phaeodactylum tricornutum CCAP 1055/1]|jgi:hypothetical protein|uniref:Uncharacterized protein n=1 Tax=Phaeodactylum tricornutum (strain CCAP 1055/1) TaxID=556484 RepID=B7FPW8_PHATC|nr:predicted protein [Phaeodactylum tricornutum CCAP 1055/1]EEC51751.1 predicted protein [Phaeodactylum tricornutum CCAP 1055/1]|eukprot:XP_002177288.1 predicted protein [Phaeodactylum tricornutum CCAP 1055/1]